MMQAIDDSRLPHLTGDDTPFIEAVGKASAFRMAATGWVVLTTATRNCPWPVTNLPGRGHRSCPQTTKGAHLTQEPSSPLASLWRSSRRLREHPLHRGPAMAIWFAMMAFGVQAAATLTHIDARSNRGRVHVINAADEPVQAMERCS